MTTKKKMLASIRALAEGSFGHSDLKDCALCELRSLLKRFDTERAARKRKRNTYGHCLLGRHTECINLRCVCCAGREE